MIVTARCSAQNVSST